MRYIFFFSIFSILFVSCGTSVKKEKTPETLEYRLASLNAGKLIDKNHSSVQRFKFLISELSKRTKEKPERIADITFNTQQHLKKEFNKNISLLELMESGYKALQGHNAPIKYDELMASFVVLLNIPK
ncbi:hypothetical protein KKF34_01245 [Myxococcota bacterium]|nr:hypothetical protein [Myxococcota bacterium]MBU1382960.1 hypothetical protein [Myxococcota bacterium]MBU1495486.1 hypothetical protein [Myxococcota bacterium]